MGDEHQAWWFKQQNMASWYANMLLVVLNVFISLVLNVNIWLVVSILLKNISQWEGLSHILWKIQNVDIFSGSYGNHHLFHKLPWLPEGKSSGSTPYPNHNPHNVRPPLDSVQLVNITPITMVHGTCNYVCWFFIFFWCDHWELWQPDLLCQSPIFHTLTRWPGHVGSTWMGGSKHSLKAGANDIAGSTMEFSKILISFNIIVFYLNMELYDYIWWYGDYSIWNYDLFFFGTTGWWLSPTPLKNDGLRQWWWHSQYMDKCSKPSTRLYLCIYIYTGNYMS